MGFSKDSPKNYWRSTKPTASLNSTLTGLLSKDAEGRRDAAHVRRMKTDLGAPKQTNDVPDFDGFM